MSDKENLSSVTVPDLDGRDAIIVDGWNYDEGILEIQLSNDVKYDFDISDQVYTTGVYRDGDSFFIQYNKGDDFEIELDIDGDSPNQIKEVSIDEDGILIHIEEEEDHRVENSDVVNGKHGNIITSVELNDDTDILKIETQSKTYDLKIDNYNGVLSNNFIDFTIDDDLNYIISTDNKSFGIEELSIDVDSFLPDFVTAIYEEEGTISVDYYHEGNTTIGNIANFNPVDTVFPESLEYNFSEKRLFIYFDNNSIISSNVIERFNGLDAISIVDWHSDTSFLMSNDGIISLPVDKNDVIQPEKIHRIFQSDELMFAEFENNDVIDIGDISSFGVDAATIMTMLGDGESLYYEIGDDFSSTITGLRGDDFNYQIEDIRLEDSTLKQISNINEVNFSDISRSLKNFYLNEGNLFVDKNYGIFDDEIGYVHGKDFDDGIWVTRFEMIDNDLVAFLSDGDRLDVNGYDRVEIDDIKINDERNELIISFKNEDDIIVPDIKGNDAVRTLIEPFISIDSDRKVVYHFDDGDVVTTERVKGLPGIRNITDMELVGDYKIDIDFDDDHKIITEKSFKWNFGFDIFDINEKHYKQDTVIKDSVAYISKIDENTNSPEESPANWQRIPTVEDSLSVLNFPDIIYPTDGQTLTIEDSFIIETSGLRSFFNGVTLYKREIQIKEKNKDWDDTISHTFFNSNKFPMIGVKEGNTYEWRVRDYASESEKSRWSPTFHFSVSNKFPMLLILENASWTPEVEAFTGSNENIEEVFFIFDNDDELDKRVEFVTQTTNKTSIPFGYLKPDTSYEFNVAIRQNGIVNISDNNEYFNTGSSLDNCKSLTISNDRFHSSRVNVDNSKYPFYNEYFKRFEDLFLIWEIKDNENDKIKTIRTRAFIDYFDLDESYGNDIDIRCRLYMESNFSPWSNSVNVVIPEKDLNTNINYNFNVNSLMLNIELYGSNFNKSDIFFNEVEYETPNNVTNKHSFEGDSFSIDTIKYMGETIKLRARALLFNGRYTTWSDITNINIPINNSFIVPPEITDFFTIEVKYMNNGNIKNIPDIVEFEVVSNNPDFSSDKETYTFNTDSTRLSFPVKHYLFDEGTVYYYRSRIFDNDLGWSDWSETKQFGYMLFTEEGEHELIVPEQVSNISFVVIGAGGGGCYTIASHTATGGALRYISNLDVVNDRTYKLKVGESAGFHTSGGDSYVYGVVRAGGGAWYGTSVATGASNIDVRGQCLVLYGGGDGGDSPGDKQSGGAGGYFMTGRLFEEEGDSGASGTVDTSAKGGGTGILGSVTSSNTYNGSQPYPEVPVAGGGGGIGTSDDVDFSQSGAIGVLFGDISYPSGMLVGWNE